ncbi:MAG: YraN family protein [Bacteroidota bacterium]|nr:YraN family protein [Bacteroidota bacterium]
MQHLHTGQSGEQLAVSYLEQKRYTILARNWKDERCEIDIIARKDGVIVFVEVKTRTGARYGWPEDAVSPAKQEKIANAAEAFLIEKGLDTEIRFDIISVIQAGDKPKIYHIQDAFAPEG